MEKKHEIAFRQSIRYFSHREKKSLSLKEKNLIQQIKNCLLSKINELIASTAKDQIQLETSFQKTKKIFKKEIQKKTDEVLDTLFLPDLKFKIKEIDFLEKEFLQNQKNYWQIMAYFEAISEIKQVIEIIESRIKCATEWNKTPEAHPGDEIGEIFDCYQKLKKILLQQTSD